MTNEEIQRTMEFILAGQARFDARMEKDEARTIRLEGAFVTLVEIARITDDRQDKTDQSVGTFDEKLSALADAQILSEAKLGGVAEAQARFDARMEKDEARIARLDDAFVTLVEIARITDERQDKTDQRVDTLARLEEAFVTVVEIARIAELRQDKTDQRVDSFDDRIEAMMSLTDAKLAELAQRLKALIDVVERYMSKGNNVTPQK